MTAGERPFSIVRIAPTAASYLRRLPRQQQQAISAAFDHLCSVSPFQHPNPTTIKPLAGKYKGLWCYRTGDIRIIYDVNTEQRNIRIVAIDSRGNVY